MNNFNLGTPVPTILFKMCVYYIGLIDINKIAESNCNKPINVKFT